MHENREISGASRPNQGRDRSVKAQSHNADMHAQEKSDCAVIPVNQPTKGEKSRGEVGEGRPRTKETVIKSNRGRTKRGEGVSKGLAAGRQAEKERRQDGFTVLLPHLSVGLLRDGF